MSDKRMGGNLLEKEMKTMQDNFLESKLMDDGVPFQLLDAQAHPRSKILFFQ